MLGRLRGIGEWTIGSVLGPAMGDPDAVAVGDYHLKNTVAWALAGEARATDEPGQQEEAQSRQTLTGPEVRPRFRVSCGSREE